MINTLLSIFFLYLPFQVAINPLEGVDLASIRILIPLIFLLWLLKSLKKKKINIPNNITTALILSFIFLSGFSLAVATNTGWGVRKLFFLLNIFVLYFVISDIKEVGTVKLLKFLTWGALISATIGTIQFFLQFIFGINETISIWQKTIIPFLGKSFSEAVLSNSSWLVNASGHTLMRSVAFFPDPHMFSFYLGMSALIAFSLYLRLNKKIYLISFLIILLADFLTFSRGGYLGLLLGTLFGIIFFQKKYIKFTKIQTKKLLLFIPIVFVIASFLIFTSNPVSDRFYSSFDISEGSNSKRIELWEKSLEIIEKNYMFGVGLGNFALSIKPSAHYREPIYSHNLYMDIAAETGLLNAIIVVSLLIFSMLTLVKRFNKENNVIYLGLASSLMVFSIHSIFETALFSVHILPLFILILGLSNTKK